MNLFRMASAAVLFSLLAWAQIGAKTDASQTSSTDAAVVAAEPLQQSSQDQTQPQGQAPKALDNNSGSGKPAGRATIRIGSGDLLEMKVFGVPEMSDQVRVNGDGNVSVPLVGAVHIAGMTSEDAERTIEDKLRQGQFLKDPHVTILVKEFATQGISVLGEVFKPGIYALIGAHRLFDAISFAGGVTNRAGRVVSITHREKPDQPQLVALSNDPAKSAAANVEIFPGDTIMVSKAGVVYVVGDVARPGGFVMDNNESLTVLQAIALAQGQNPSASLNNAKLIRKSPLGLQEIPVPLKKILESKADDIAMQGEDILFIPTSASKSAMRRSLEAAVQMATGVAIYRR